MKINTAFFSATNTTKTVVKEIAQTMGTDIQPFNLTIPSFTADQQIPQDELLLVGMPVYGGRIPAVAVPSLQRFKGHQTPAILVAVYGNREYEDALVEMQDILEANGFVILAAGTFIAQHSIFPKTAQGRPDAADHLKIKDFAQRCLKKMAEYRTGALPKLSLPGNRPYKVPGNIPLKVVTGKTCTACGACVKVCPVGAIPVDHPQTTDYEKCIHCGRCQMVCTAHARHYGGLLYQVAGAVFGWKNRKRKEPDFFL